MIRTILTLVLGYHAVGLAYAALYPSEFAQVALASGYRPEQVAFVKGQAAGLAGLCSVGVLAVGYSHWAELQRTKHRLEALVD